MAQLKEVIRWALESCTDSKVGQQISNSMCGLPRHLMLLQFAVQISCKFLSWSTLTQNHTEKEIQGGTVPTSLA